MKLLGTPSEKIWDGFNQLKHTQKWNFKQYPHSYLRRDFSFLTDSGFRLLNALLSVSWCAGAVRRHERRTGITFDMFAYTRPDLVR